jgi:CrcB protein
MTSRLPPVRNLGYVALGGAIGAVARVALAGWFPPAAGGFPRVTFLENVVGAFLLALVLTRLTERLAADPAIRLVVCTGALGSFTTYGTMAVELQRLAAGERLAVAGGYALATLVSGVLAGLLGLRIARGRALPGVRGHGIGDRWRSP